MIGIHLTDGEARDEFDSFAGQRKYIEFNALEQRADHAEPESTFDNNGSLIAVKDSGSKFIVAPTFDDTATDILIDYIWQHSFDITKGVSLNTVKTYKGTETEVRPQKNVDITKIYLVRPAIADADGKIIEKGEVWIGGINAPENIDNRTQPQTDDRTKQLSARETESGENPRKSFRTTGFNTSAGRRSGKGWRSHFRRQGNGTRQCRRDK